MVDAAKKSSTWRRNSSSCRRTPGSRFLTPVAPAISPPLIVPVVGAAPVGATTPAAGAVVPAPAVVELEAACVLGVGEPDVVVGCGAAGSTAVVGDGVTG